MTNDLETLVWCLVWTVPPCHPRSEGLILHESRCGICLRGVTCDNTDHGWQLTPRTEPVSYLSYLVIFTTQESTGDSKHEDQKLQASFFYGFSFQSSLSETHEKGVPILKRKKKLYFQQFYGYSKPRNLMFMILMFRISWEWLSESNETCPGVTWHTQVLTRFSQWSWS